MRKYTTGFVLVNLALAASIAMPTFFLWDVEHIGNPLWHPHAKFHGVQLWLLMVVAATVGFAALWRSHHAVMRQRDHGAIPLGIVLAVPLAFWFGEFVAWPIPGTDVRPDLENPNTFPLLGFDMYGNAFGAVLVILLFSIGYALITSGQRSFQRPKTPRAGVYA